MGKGGSFIELLILALPLPLRKTTFIVVSRWALKIVVGAREQGTLNWEQEESFE